MSLSECEAAEFHHRHHAGLFILSKVQSFSQLLQTDLKFPVLLDVTLRPG
jgi:hypothetical protein